MAKECYWAVTPVLKPVGKGSLKELSRKQAFRINRISSKAFKSKLAATRAMKAAKRGTQEALKVHKVCVYRVKP